MNGRQALAFVRKHGIVLASARGPVPNVAEAIVREPIKGSWWGHPKGREIFRILQQLSASPDILVCRLIDGKRTFVHRRLWPAVVRVAEHLTAEGLAQVREEHTPGGHHVTHETPFPQWVPSEILQQAQEIGEEDAFTMLGTWTAHKRGS